MPRKVHVGDLFDPNYLLETPLLAGCNKDESDQKSAAKIYKSVPTYNIPEMKIRLLLLYD